MRLNILGCGVMGQQISSLALLLGFDVHVWTRGDAASRTADVSRQMKRDRRNLGELLSGPEGTLSVTSDLQALAPALTVETVSEEIAVKHAVLSRLPFDWSAVQLVTNTSSFRPDEVHPRAVGFHFFNPATMLRFVEVAAAPGMILAEGQRFLDSLAAVKFDIIPVAPNRGYIGNTLLFREIANALELIEQHGYSTRAIDSVLKHTGRAASLFDIVDLVGVDITLSILKNLNEKNPNIRVPPALETAVKLGVLGRKNKTTIRSVLDAVRPDGG